MKIKWINIFVLGILVCFIVLLFRLSKILDRLPDTVELPHYITSGPTFAIFCLGLICVTIVAVVKILANR